MRKTSLTVGLAAAMLLALSAPAPAAVIDEHTEGCIAYNPGLPTCSHKITHKTVNRGGATGVGSWIVTVQRGEKTFRLESSGGPAQLSFVFRPGDRIRVKTLAPGSFVAAGNAY